jgi:hypothetical protein
LTFVQLQHEAEPRVIATEPLAGTGPVAFDTKTDDAVVVRSNSHGSGAEVQHFSASPPRPSPSPSAR